MDRTGQAVEKKKVGFWGWALRIAAVGYPLALLAIVLGLRFVGERWWVTTVGLYLPRRPFAAPLPFLVLALALAGPRRLLVTQAVALVILVVPLFGWTCSLGGRATPGASSLRVLSFNTDEGAFGLDRIIAVIRDASPDIVLLQEADDIAGSLAAGLPGYHVQSSGQFAIASRLPIAEAIMLPKLVYGGVLRSVRGMRYRLQGPAGPIQVYSVHPPSPRDGLAELRGGGLRREIESGRLLDNVRAARMVATVAGLRAAQLRAVAADAAASPYPVIIAGDTNLPGLSWAFAQAFGRLQDGFREVGTGFGYTFPANRRPWMRIDRVLADDHFRFLRFEVVPVLASDHRPVVADLELVPARS